MTDFAKAIEEAKAAVLPYESWERLAGESPLAYSAFCAYRDFGPGRTVRKAAETAPNKLEAEKDEGRREKRCRVWRNWCGLFRWRERAADYDRHIERMKQEELRKTIEAQGEKHRLITGKMLDVVGKKLDTMNPEDLTQGNVTEWVQTAIRADREAGQFTDANCLGVSASRNSTPKQGELVFTPEFDGL
jgi:hypothetical protein